ATLDLAEPDHTVDFRDRRRILGTPRFEQFGDSRQTASDVARLVRLSADLRDRHTGSDWILVADDDLCANRNHEVADTLFLAALRLPDLNVRVQLLLAVFDHDTLTQTGELVVL